MSILPRCIERYDTDLLLLCFEQLPFDLNSRGAAETDATLRVRKHSRVFALGDVSGIDPQPQDSALPATAQVWLCPARAVPHAFQHTACRDGAPALASAQVSGKHPDQVVSVSWANL